MQPVSSVSVHVRPGPAESVPKPRLLSLAREQLPGPGRLLLVSPPTPSTSQLMGVEAKDSTLIPQVLLGAPSTGTQVPLPHPFPCPSSRLHSSSGAGSCLCFSFWLGVLLPPECNFTGSSNRIHLRNSGFFFL